MTLTEHERVRLRAMWRRLAMAAGGLDAEAMRGVSGDVLGLASPIDGKAESFTLFAFGRLAFAYVRGGAGYRTQAGPALSALAELAGAVLDASDPGAAPRAPQLPFRADLDN